MRIKLISIICLFFSIQFLFSENFSLNGRYVPNLYSTVDVVTIDDEVLVFKYEVDLPEKVLDYKIIKIDGLNYFELSENIPKEFDEDYYYGHNDFTTDNKILFLAGKELDFEYYREGDIKKKDRILLFATTAGFDTYYPFIYQMHSFAERLLREYVDCSSHLTEKTKDYPVKNLNEFNVDTPWVEGVKGDGIGEGFTIKKRDGTVFPYLLIMNGYISYKKPYLYKQNNRIKKIKVTGLKSGKSKILDVLDTPHPQTVDISFLTEPEDIRIEIADVYKGTKYDDTCLHFCVTYTNEVIPYENSIGD